MYKPIRSKTKSDEHITKESELKNQLVGREHEVAIIDRKLRALSNIDRPVGGVLLLQGSSGCGKTRLTRYIRTRAPDLNIEVLSGAGLDVEYTTPYFAWRSIFLQLINLQDEDCKATEVNDVVIILSEDYIGFMLCVDTLLVCMKFIL